LEKIKSGATYCPAALQQIIAVVVVPFLGDERGTTTNSFLPFQSNYFGRFVGNF
jgi:hypothetical protein